MITLEKTAKIRTSNCRCMAGMGETCNHVTSFIYFVEAVDSSNRFDQFCLYKQMPMCGCQNQKTIEPKKIKYLDFSRRDFGQSSSLTENEVWSTEKLWFKTIEHKGFCWSYQQTSPSKYITYCDIPVKGGFCQKSYFNKNCST